MVVGSTRREGGAGDANKLASALRLRTASEDDGLWSDSISSPDSDFSLSGHVPLARPFK